MTTTPIRRHPDTHHAAQTGRRHSGLFILAGSILASALVLAVAWVASQAVRANGSQQGWYLDANGDYVTVAPPKGQGGGAPAGNGDVKQPQAQDLGDGSVTSLTARLDANLTRWYRAVGHQAFERKMYAPDAYATGADIAAGVHYWLTTAPQQNNSISGVAPLGVLDVVHGADQGPWSLKPLGSKPYNVAAILSGGTWCKTEGPMRYLHTRVRLPSPLSDPGTLLLWVQFRYYALPQSLANNQGVWLVSVSDQTPRGC